MTVEGAVDGARGTTMEMDLTCQVAFPFAVEVSYSFQVDISPCPAGTRMLLNQCIECGADEYQVGCNHRALNPKP